MSENKKPCPQFPYWGASYPDACCVDGILQDLDYCDENVIFMIRERMFPAHFAGQKNL
ncbi:Uncharacterised protein [Bacteroides uniformis]|uniref:Uncharacterized protein n=1 Tax=Bacteroides uniformis TaxID=820 RepID=A0A174M5Z3_BACUN|nr:Uncharacterised protein [Bacteroides uniformis]DAN78669.1 MAG TPA: hypothetical protein [Caudoviricetes sp.]